MTSELVRVHLRIDRRRPASWLAAATAAAAVAWLATQSPPEAGLRVAAAVAAGAVVAGMAIGEPPRGLYGSVRGWVWLRAAWPLASAVVAAGACVWVGGAAGGEPLCAAALLCGAMAATAEACVASVRGGATPADTASLPLVLGGFAAAAAVAAGTTFGVGAASCVAAACAAWIACRGGLAGWQQQRAALIWPDSPAAVGVFASGPEGQLLAGIAMTTALAGMVGWLFLAADAVGWYRLLAAAWFTAAAVPQATLAAAEVERRGRPAAAWATLLGWPLVVATVLAPSSTAAVERAVSVGGLVAAAVALTLLAAGLRRAGASRETTLAVALAAALVAVIGICMWKPVTP
jgi:hypothetical protein